ncbi:MAG TPA: PAS domain-containing protein, partial [Acidimicrobiales bacterium]|nr:PAS domain-containing protein [Acidimicrobiales bacterium]
MLYSAEFLDSIRTGLVLEDATGAVVGLNGAASSLLGLEPTVHGDRRALTPWRGAVREDGEAFAADELPTARTLATGATNLDVVVGVDLSGRVRRWLSVDTYPITLDGGAPGVVAAFDDIDTQWHERHLLRLLAEVNRVVIATSDEATSLQHLCATLVEKGPYALAWIGVATHDPDGTIESTYAAGATDYLYEGMTSVAADRPTGLGPSGMALRTG